jgi:type IV pilus assembly protein PilV
VTRISITSSWTRRQRGLSLIEILIALVVVSVGLLGMAGLQAYSIRNNNSAYQRSQANTLAYDFLDCVRTIRNDWVMKGAATCSTGGESGSAACDVSTRALLDMQNWKVNMERLLPESRGDVVCNANRVCTVIVQWDDTRGVVKSPQAFIVSTML